jgi:hypothetical protein
MTPSPSPASFSRKQRLNMNVTHDDHTMHGQQYQLGPRNRSFDKRQHGANEGRGRYNKKN